MEVKQGAVFIDYKTEAQIQASDRKLNMRKLN